MEKETLQRFSREMMSLYALIVINIVGAGLAMSYGSQRGSTTYSP